MEHVNPYSPPTAECTTSLAAKPPRRWHAGYFVGASVIVSLAYTYCDEVVFGTSFGAWPMLITTLAISIVSVLVTRNIFLSPFCCFAGTMSGDILVGLLRSWKYAQMEYCIPLAIGFSIPALLLGLILPRRKVPEQKDAITLNS